MPGRRSTSSLARSSLDLSADPENRSAGGLSTEARRRLPAKGERHDQA